MLFWMVRSDARERNLLEGISKPDDEKNLSCRTAKRGIEQISAAEAAVIRSILAVMAWRAAGGEEHILHARLTIYSHP